MISRVTRLFFVAWFVVVGLLLARASHHGWSASILAGLYVLVLGQPTLAALQFLVARQVDRRAGRPLAPLRRVVRAWHGEWRANTLVFGWRLPWRANAWPDHLPKTSRGLRGVVFIHGYICNRGVWNPWLARLHKLDRAFVAVDLEPVFGSIDDYAPIIERAVRRVEAATGLAPIIVAHSMGGLAARAWLRSRRRPSTSGHPGDPAPLAAVRSDGHEDVARIITIGTPHRGTWMSRASSSINGRQMRIDGDWLETLRADEPEPLCRSFSCWWSESDQVVFPSPTAVLPGSEAHQIRGSGHVAMAEREEIWAELRRRLDY